LYPGAVARGYGTGTYECMISTTQKSFKRRAGPANLRSPLRAGLLLPPFAPLRAVHVLLLCSRWPLPSAVGLLLCSHRQLSVPVLSPLLPHVPCTCCCSAPAGRSPPRWAAAVLPPSAVLPGLSPLLPQVSSSFFHPLLLSPLLPPPSLDFVCFLSLFGRGHEGRLPRLRALLPRCRRPLPPRLLPHPRRPRVHPLLGGRPPPPGSCCLYIHTRARVWCSSCSLLSLSFSSSSELVSSAAQQSICRTSG